MIWSRRTGRRNSFARIPRELIASEPRSMHVFAHVLHDNVCCLVADISPATTIGELKNKIANVHTGLPAWQQRLFHKGRRLEDAHTMGSYDIRTRDIINVHFNL